MPSLMILGGHAKPHDYYVTEVWGINSQYGLPIPNRDRMFDLHHYYILERDGWDFQPEIDFHNKFKQVPLYTLEKWPVSIRNQRIFPATKLMNLMPRGKYHCGSFDWLVAYAVWLQLFDHIILNGISLSITEFGEPLSARACLEYWCGYAEAIGIKVTAINSDLFTWMHIVKTKQIYSVDDVTVMEDRT